MIQKSHIYTLMWSTDNLIEVNVVVNPQLTSDCALWNISIVLDLTDPDNLHVMCLSDAHWRSLLRIADILSINTFNLI